ncbi:MAG: hypothetical protein ACI94L_000318 [Flavobacteriaceae bacterium]|jgi:hypothetical protein
MLSRLLIFISVMLLCTLIGITSIAQLSQSKFIESADYDGYFSSISTMKLLTFGPIGAMTVFRIAVTGRDTLIKSTSSETSNKGPINKSTSLMCGNENDHPENSTMDVIHAEELTC